MLHGARLTQIIVHRSIFNRPQIENPYTTRLMNSYGSRCTESLVGWWKQKSIMCCAVCLRHISASPCGLCNIPSWSSSFGGTATLSPGKFQEAFWKAASIERKLRRSVHIEGGIATTDHRTNLGSVILEVSFFTTRSGQHLGLTPLKHSRTSKPQMKGSRLQ